MTHRELREAWAQIRPLLEAAMAEHNDDYGHACCPWGGDAYEYSAAFDYTEEVLAYLHDTEHGYRYSCQGCGAEIPRGYVSILDGKMDHDRYDGERWEGRCGPVVKL